MTDDRAVRKPLTPAMKRLIRSAGVASVAVAVTLVTLKAWAWLTTGSIAMLGSLADSVLDLLASIMILVAVRFALEPADREHRFGHGKLEAVAGLVQSLVIAGSAAYVCFEAVTRLLAPEPIAAPAAGVLVTLVSLALTISLVVYQRFVVGRTGSIAIGADAVHYKADVLTNIAVLVAIAASAWLGWHRADPVLGLIVVVIIVTSVRTIVLQAFDVLLDRELPGEQRREILELARRHPEVLGVHDLRTRTSGTHEFIQLHLELEPRLPLARVHEISVGVERVLMARFPRAEVIIHADPYGIDEPQDDF
ncbi:MAG TPA: cation diffusion facilitator family transporter [Gammaproteobacteria bacterium]|nr:cation diffusion facilitator family transporter [Gammaproteobacteria bacterium]